MAMKWSTFPIPSIIILEWNEKWGIGVSHMIQPMHVHGREPGNAEQTREYLAIASAQRIMLHIEYSVYVPVHIKSK